MLMELFHAAKNLRKQGIDAPWGHVDLTRPGLSSYETLYGLIGHAGPLERLTVKEASDLGDLWVLRKGTSKPRYFPTIRLSQPLLSIPLDDSTWKSLQSPSPTILIGLLQSHWDSLSPIDVGDELNTQVARIQKWTHPNVELLTLLQSFAGAFKNIATEPKRFAEHIAGAAIRSLNESSVSDNATRCLQSLICGVLQKGRKQAPKIGCDVQIIFDYRPSDALDGTLYRPIVRRFIGECLNLEKDSGTNPDTEGAASTENEAAVCAFQDADPSLAGPLLKGPFADWSASAKIEIQRKGKKKQITIGFSQGFKPYSKFSAARCNARYGKADSAGLLVGAATAREIVAAANKLTQREWLNKTWRPVFNGKVEERNDKKTESSDILIAYPSFEWDKLAPVSIFARSEVPDDGNPLGDSAQTFGEVAEPFAKVLTQNVSADDLARGYIRLLLIRRVDRARVQLTYSAAPTRKRFADAVTAWMASEKNLPAELRLPLPSKRIESGFGSFAPRLLFPEDAIRVFSYQWTRAGTDNTRLQSPSVGEVLDLLLRREGVWEDTATRLLATLLPRIEPLLIGAGGLMRRLSLGGPFYWTKEDQERWRASFPKAANYTLLNAVSLIGTLLHALNSRKEKYMEQAPFRLGKLLAIMDQLHKCYCIDERDGDLPATLIGNGLLGHAGDSPQEALEELCDRSRIYLGWAKTAQITAKTPEENKNAINSAHELLLLAEPIAESLHNDAALREPLSTEAKAHLFLGYLSRVLGRGKDAAGREQEVAEMAPTSEE